MASAETLLESIKVLGDRLEANLLFLVTDDRGFLAKAIAGTKLPVVVATSRTALQEEFAADVRAALRVSEPLSGTFHDLDQVKDILLGAYLEGTVVAGDRVLCVVSSLDAFDILVHFDVDRDLEFSRLREELAERVDMKVIERILRLAVELAREGREGTPVGTIFVVGDVQHVLNHSRQLVINPFQGHLEEDRNLLDDELWETMKEFAQLDGAFIVREDGVVEAAGRYIETDRRVELQSGLGGRHLAAASISNVTKGIAVTVSASGAIRIFRDGRIILMVGRF